VLRYVTLRNGGGEDTLEDRLGGRGMIDIYDLDGTPVAGPIMEHVAIYGSTSYGIFMDQEDSDDTPPILNNLTITGTARAPLGMYVAAAGGLGTGNTFVDNEQNVIEIRAGTVAGGRMNYDQTWPKQPVPYQLVSDFGPLAVRDAVLTIEPGTTIQMEEGMGFRVGEGTLLANGTPTEPITFTRASENAGQWGNILLISNIDPPASFSYVSLLHAQGDGGAINHQAGQLKLDHVTAKFNQNAGVYSQGDFVQIKDSVFQLNRQGIRLQHGAGGLLRRNDISNNTEAGLVIQDNDDVCVDALQNYWGSPNGPSDTSSSEDACGSTATNDSSGDSISDGALYSPWLSSLDGQRQGASRISPAEFWVIANGVQSTTLDITVRDAQGVPLADKEIALETTRGTIAQPTAPTDENGVTTARISSEEVGEAIITARNVTDNESLSAMAAVYFWRGGGDTAGLIDQSGAPYASPNLILEGLPFQRGQAMTFRLPMENSNADAAVVEVDYAVSGLGIGRSFGTVDVVSKTLQPGEAWDAAGGWIVDVEGHHCVQARVKVTLPEQRVLQEVVNVGPFQVNFDVPDDPCKEQDVKKLIPRSGGLKGVRKHMTKLLIQTYLVKECLNQTLSFSSVQSNGQHSTPAQDNDGEREHDVVTTVPEYTPATFEANDELTQAKADALNTLAQVVADLSALDDAIATTNQRIKWAGQANDEEAEARQFAAYRGFKQQYAQKLFDLAESIQTILSLTRDADEPDTFFTPEDYQDYRRQLRTAGYTQDTLSYHQEFGLSNELIDAIREEEIDRLAEQGSSTTTFYSFLETVREGAQARAEDLQEQYGSGEASAGLAAENPTLFTLSPLQSTFTVANPRDEQHTVNLKVRPVDLPLSWSYELDTSAPTLAAGETTTVTLTLSPGDGGQAVEGSTVRVAVEGFIDGEYIGGVLLQQRTPWTPETLAQREEPAAAGDVYLPLIRK
jgi:VCBS repeat-containing protein